MANRNQYFKSRINIKKGISGVGGVLGERVEKEERYLTFLEVGDIVVRDKAKEEVLKQFRSPIAYDIWYLNHFVNMLSVGENGTDNIPDDYLGEQLDFLKLKLEGIKPLSFLRDLNSLVKNERDRWDWDDDINPTWFVNSEYFINLLAYENWFPEMLATYDSEGPEKKFGFKREDAIGYLAFPVGQLGVMEVVSILKQSKLDAADFKLQKEEMPITESSCEYFFSPTDQYTGKNKCFGEHIIESGYIIPKDNGIEYQPNKRLNVEYLNVTWIPPSKYADIRPQFWMRYWINKEEKFPIPGEFIGILVKPLALPPHLWWFQKTSPYLHAGNWVETNNLTSGLVVKKQSEKDRGGEAIGTLYTVKVQGYDIIIESSDFMDYNVGDRVGIVKVSSAKEIPATLSFTWSDMTLLGEEDKEQQTSDYKILPISFYK